MIELFLDTSTNISFLALLKNKKVIKQEEIISNNDLSNIIFSYIKNMFEIVNIKPEEVTKIYVAEGPGSFTGIRIGMTIAKVYAYTIGISLIPVSTLQILASSSQDKVIVPLINARRGYVYAGVYDENLNIIEEDKYIDLNVIREKYPEATYITNDIFDFKTVKPSVNIEKIVSKHRNDETKNIHSINPNYTKNTEAEEKLSAGN